MTEDGYQMTAPPLDGGIPDSRFEKKAAAEPIGGQMSEVGCQMSEGRRAEEEGQAVQAMERLQCCPIWRMTASRGATVTPFL